RAEAVCLGSFLNLGAITKRLQEEQPSKLLLICSGTRDEASLEDSLAVGALCESLWPLYSGGHLADSAQVARQLYISLQSDLLGAMHYAENGRRLLSIPELADDVPFCLRRDMIQVVARLESDGAVRLVA